MTKLAIHSRKGSFSDRWIEICESENLDYKVVDIYKVDNLSELSDCNGFLWHWVHHEVRDILFATSFIHTVEKMGIQVYPNLDTCWHFDDKVAQSIYLEATRAPVAKSYIFYDKNSAKEWIKNAQWPKVFKLRRGAGATNVKLVNNSKEALKLCNTAFGTGFNSVLKAPSILSSQMKSVNNIDSFRKLIKKIPNGLRKHKARKLYTNRERGYLYFQEFMPENSFDTRITVIGDKAFAFRRKNRTNDFRASGSGIIDYDQSSIDKRCIKLAFEMSEKMGSQSMAYDFVMNQDKEPVFVEMSYAFVASAIQKCDGYYDQNLEWHPGESRVEDLVLENLLKSIEATQ